MDWLYYEKEYKAQGKKLICGVDEAGRGPLAGPVCAAAVILPDGIIIEGVNDSKKLTPKKRELLYQEITNRCIDYSISFVDSTKIDEINILNATYLAMETAVKSLKNTPDMVLVDGNSLPKWDFESVSIIKGDALSHSIACASILAKVSRDRFMTDMAEKFPLYGFEKHKGYGTKAHIEAIKTHGICELHRKTFLRNILGNE